MSRTLLLIALLLNSAGAFPWPQVLTLINSAYILCKSLSGVSAKIPALVPMYLVFLMTQVLSYYGLGNDGDLRAYLAYVTVSFLNVLIIFCICFLYQRNQTDGILPIMTLSTVVIAIEVMLNLLALVRKGIPLNRIIDLRLVQTPLGSTNFLAVISAIILPYCFAYLTTAKRLAAKGLGVAGVVSAFFTVLLSTSRNGLMMVLLSTVLSAWSYSRLRLFSFGKRLSRFIIMSALGATILAVFIWQLPIIGTKIASRWSNLGTLSGRTFVWKEALDTIVAGAWIIGVGTGQLTGQYVQTFPHNIFLQVAVWGGIASLMVFVVMIGYLELIGLRVICKKRVKGGSSSLSFLTGKAAAVSVIVGTVASLGEITIGTPAFDMFFWIGAALLVSTSSGEMRSPNSRQGLN